MRKTCLIILLICLNITMMAQRKWTMKTVPNTRLESNDIHVSDPDDYLSDSAEMNINTALCAIRDKADVFLVTLASIGDAESKSFATDLFNYWGIGDAETNNGVLLLFVEDQHAMEFETGYGAEETLTDAKCQRIFTNTIVPFFRAGDYEGGLCAGVADIVAVYGGEIPMGLKTTLPSQTGNDTDDGFDDVGNYLWLGLFGMFLFAMPIVGIVFWARKRKDKKRVVPDTYHAFDENGVTYVDGINTKWSGSPWEGKGCLGGMMLGLSIFVILFMVVAFMTLRYPDVEQSKLYSWIALATLLLYLTWICFRYNQRALKTAKKLAERSINPKSVYQAAFKNIGNRIATWAAPWLGWIYYLVFKKRMEQSGACNCPKCSGNMEKYSGFKLPETHVVEERVGALKFTPYRCGQGHVIVVKEHGKQYSKFKTCSKCGAYTLQLTQSKTLVNADYSHDGKKEETYVCQLCGETLTKMVVIPMLVHYSSSSGGSGYSSSSSSSRSYSSHSSSHSSGGSFGGGHSGGGGYSGKW